MAEDPGVNATVTKRIQAVLETIPILEQGIIGSVGDGSIGKTLDRN